MTPLTSMKPAFPHGFSICIPVIEQKPAAGRSKSNTVSGNVEFEQACRFLRNASSFVLIE